MTGKKKEYTPWRSLIAMRTEQGKNMSDVAFGARINLPHYSLIERGHVRPKAPTIARIADALGVRPSDIPLPDVEEGVDEGGLSPLAQSQVRRIVREEIAEYVRRVQRGEEA